MPARILLVDDEDDVLDAWEMSLRPLRHNVVKTHNEAEAVAAAMEHPFDIVLVDYLVPSKTGVEIVAALRKQLPMIRSILISGRFDEKLSGPELREMIRDKVEVDEYLHKPVKPKVLRETVTRLLGGAPLNWKEVAQQSKKAKAVSEQDATEVTNRLKPHLKPKGK